MSEKKLTKSQLKEKEENSLLDSLVKQGSADTKVVQEELNAGGLFAAVAFAVAGVIAYTYHELYVLSSPVHLGVLGGVAVISALLLSGAYNTAAHSALKRKFSNTAAQWYALFQVNFWFFALFGLLGGVLLPALGETGRALPGGKQTYGLVSYAMATALPAFLLFFSGKTKYY